MKNRNLEAIKEQESGVGGALINYSASDYNKGNFLSLFGPSLTNSAEATTGEGGLTSFLSQCKMDDSSFSGAWQQTRRW